MHRGRLFEMLRAIAWSTVGGGIGIIGSPSSLNSAALPFRSRHFRFYWQLLSVTGRAFEADWVGGAAVAYCAHISACRTPWAYLACSEFFP